MRSVYNYFIPLNTDYYNDTTEIETDRERQNTTELCMENGIGTMDTGPLRIAHNANALEIGTTKLKWNNQLTTVWNEMTQNIDMTNSVANDKFPCLYVCVCAYKAHALELISPLANYSRKMKCSLIFKQKKFVYHIDHGMAEE